MRLLPLSLALLLGACAAGPNYVRPALDLPARFTAGSMPAESAPADPPSTPVERLERLELGQDIPAAWWEAFHSEPLDALVTASIAHNPTLEAARAALRSATEAAQAERAAYYPNATLGFSPSRQRIADAVASPVSSGATYYNLVTAQVSVSYAPDVFGATRRQVESAEAQAEFQRFQLEATYLTLTSNVVVAAITEASLRAQREATLQVVAAQREVLASTRLQATLGELGPADVSAQEAALANTEATLPPLEKQLALQRILLTTLAGRYPSDEIDARFELAALQLPQELPLTLPSALVEHRPDVRAAEAQLQSASAQIGVAVAARLPSVTLGASSYGVSSTTFSRLFSSSAIFWTLAAGVTQPLFDAGALAHREGAARASFDQAAAQYRATVLGAFQDVAGALEAIGRDRDALRAAADAERAVRVNVDRTRRQVQLGDASPLALRVAEQGAQQAAVALAQAQAARLTDAAALFQALGGGWWNRSGDLAGAPPTAAAGLASAAPAVGIASP